MDGLNKEMCVGLACMPFSPWILVRLKFEVFRWKAEVEEILAVKSVCLCHVYGPRYIHSPYSFSFSAFSLCKD